MLMPYFDQANLGALYDHNQPWENQTPTDRPDGGAAVFMSFELEGEPVKVPGFASFGVPVGEVFGATDYVFCKGSGDSWCLPMVTAEQRGFYANRGTRLAEITDGTSQTIAMGEGAGGRRWPLCRAGCTTLFAAASGNLVASNAWLSGGLGASFLSDAGIVVAGVWACTVQRPNKWPVTDNWIDLGAVQDCRSSYQGGKHSTSNFRSDHSAGLYFLFADGSVRWIATSIDLTEYRALGTIAGGETVVGSGP